MSATLCAGFLLLSLAACRTTGVEIGDEELIAAIGMTEEEIRAEYGVPHSVSEDSDGVLTLGYGMEKYRLWRLDQSSSFEFTLVEGRVVKTSQTSTRRIADKNRAR